MYLSTLNGLPLLELHGLHPPRQLLLPLSPRREARLHLLHNLRQLHVDAVFLWVAVRQAHLLDLDHPRREFVLAQDDGVGHAVLLRARELLRELWLDLVEELGLSPPPPPRR